MNFKASCHRFTCLRSYVMSFWNHNVILIVRVIHELNAQGDRWRWRFFVINCFLWTSRWFASLSLVYGHGLKYFILTLRHLVTKKKIDNNILVLLRSSLVRWNYENIQFGLNMFLYVVDENCTDLWKKFLKS